MTLRFGTTNEDLLDAQLWATATTGVVHLVEVYDEETSTVTFDLAGEEVTDTYGVLYGVPDAELAAFEEAHGGRTLVLETFHDGQVPGAWARQMLNKLRDA